MARHMVEICGVNTANIRVLKSEETLELLKKYKEGDTSLKEQIVNGNLKLVLSILKKYNNKVENMDDLFQIGSIGLLKAIDNFDLSHGVKFSTYAVPMIVGEIKRYLRDNNSVRVARSIKDNAYRILKFKESYINKYGKEPTSLIIKENLNLEEHEISLALNSLKDTISMFEPIYNDGGDVIYLEDQLKSSEGVYDKNIKIALKDALKKIKEKERYILIQRYLIGKTQMELSLEIGISQAQISRLEKNGLETIRKMIS